jgi:hypothetical protein
MEWVAAGDIGWKRGEAVLAFSEKKLWAYGNASMCVARKALKRKAAVDRVDPGNMSGRQAMTTTYCFISRLRAEISAW